MKIVTNKLDDEVRDEIIRYVGDFIANLPAGAKVEVTFERGVREVTKPGEPIRSWQQNDTSTLQILVNGGAKDEPL